MKLNIEMFCPAFEELNKLALQTVVSKDLSDEGRKHRRAVIAHPATCNHPVCVATFKLMKKVGIDDIDFTGLAEEVTKEKLK